MNDVKDRLHICASGGTLYERTIVCSGRGTDVKVGFIIGTDTHTHKICCISASGAAICVNSFTSKPRQVYFTVA